MRLPFGRKRRRKSFSSDGARIVEFSPTVANLVRLGGLGSYAAIFATQPAVHGTVNFIARNIAQLGLKTYLKVTSNNRRELPEHPMQQLLEDPNDEDSAYELKYNFVADLAVYDRAYWAKVRAGDQLGLMRLPPDRVLHVGETMLGPTGFRVSYPNGQFRDFTREDVVYAHGYSPVSNAHGAPPLEALRMILLEDFAASKARAKFWTKGGLQDYAITRPLEAPPWDDEGELRFLEKWLAQTSGPDNADRTGILDEGMSLVERNSQTARNAEFVAGRIFTYETVARIWQIPPAMVGLVENGAGFGSVQEQHKMLYQDALGPWLEKLQGVIEKQLLPEFEKPRSGVYVEFNLAEKLKGSFEEQAASLVTLTGRPILTGEEARSRLNLNPTGQRDMQGVILPLNVMVGGQSSPQMPTDVPKPEPQPVPPGEQAPAPGKTGAKAKLAGSEMAEMRDAVAEEHARKLSLFYERQRRVVKSSGSFGLERWNSELRTDLLDMMMETTALFGKWAAEKIGGRYDVDRTRAYWEAEAEAVSSNVNSSIQDSLRDSDPDTVFDARVGESTILATQRATRGMSWAVLECARQNGAG